jgi:hypothetical protein
MLSAEYLQLCKRVEELRKHLLPPTFDPTGNYSAAEYDRVRGYVALVHAEIEAFIESRCLVVASKCVDDWVKHRKTSPVVISLHAICYGGWDGLIEQPAFKKLSNEISVEARLHSALAQYSQAVGGNNGIKEADLKRLLIPLSIRMNDLNPNWLVAMDSFGGVRGQIAHQTSVGVVQQPDPKDLRRLVWKDLVLGLRDLDLLLTRLSLQLAHTSPGPIGRKPDWVEFRKSVKAAWNSVFGS